jgi:hypothetical protein
MKSKPKRGFPFRYDKEARTLVRVEAELPVTPKFKAREGLHTRHFLEYWKQKIEAEAMGKHWWPSESLMHTEKLHVLEGLRKHDKLTGAQMKAFKEWIPTAHGPWNEYFAGWCYREGFAKGTAMIEKFKRERLIAKARTLLEQIQIQLQTEKLQNQNGHSNEHSDDSQADA